MRQPETPGDRGGRDGVGRRHDGAERDGAGPSQPGQDRASDQCDGGGCGKHEPDGEKRDRPQVRPKIAPGRKVGRGPQDRRKKDQEHQIGIEPDQGKAGQHPQDQSPHDKQDRVGDEDGARDGGERQHRHQQQDDDLKLLQAIHGFREREQCAPTGDND